MDNIYKVRICFGDGKPLETDIKAKSGIKALDEANKTYPGARNVHVLSVKQDKPKQQPKIELTSVKPAAPVVDESIHPLFTDVTYDDVKRYINRDKLHRMKLIQSAIELKKKGLTHRRIAASLGVGLTTVGTWLKQYSPD